MSQAFVGFVAAVLMAASNFAMPMLAQDDVLRTLISACTGCTLPKNLHGRDLHGLRFVGADLRGADLSGTNLRDAQFTGSDIEGARFNDADLTGARFIGVRLNHVSFAGAKLTGATFVGVSISKTDVPGNVAREGVGEPLRRTASTFAPRARATKTTARSVRAGP